MVSKGSPERSGTALPVVANRLSNEVAMSVADGARTDAKAVFQESAQGGGNEPETPVEPVFSCMQSVD